MTRSFEEWKKLVDAELLRRCGMTSEDMPDWDYRSAWEDDESPVIAARHAIRAAREY